MIISAPRYVMLDTSTINHAADNPGDCVVIELVRLLNDGQWIPYVTFHHLEEIAQHENDETFKRRQGFLSTLPQISFPKIEDPSTSVGDCVSLRDLEIQILLKKPTATLFEVISEARPKLRNGLCSGATFVQENWDFWECYRALFAATRRAQLEYVANTTHFSLENPKARIPKVDQNLETRPPEEAAHHFAKMANWLSKRIAKGGDVRNVDPKASATHLMSEAFNETTPLLGSSGNLFEKILESVGVHRERLPVDPRAEDVGYEAVFIAQLKIHARRLLKNLDELRNLIRKEALPSWVVWQTLDQNIKRLPKAEIGNITDKHIALFGFYVDVLNVDKRIAEMIRQASRRNDLFKILHDRVPAKRGLAGLVEALKK